MSEKLEKREILQNVADRHEYAGGHHNGVVGEDGIANCGDIVDLLEANVTFYPLSSYRSLSSFLLSSLCSSFPSLFYILSFLFISGNLLGKSILQEKK